MKRLLALIALCSLCFVSTASAQSSDMNVRILPMDCQFTVIDAGTNQIEYLTPATCNNPNNPNPEPPIEPGEETPIEPGLEPTQIPTDTTFMPGTPEASQNHQVAPATDIQNPIRELANVLGFEEVTSSQVAAVSMMSTGVVGTVGLAADAALFQGGGRKYIHKRIRVTRLRPKL